MNALDSYLARATRALPRRDRQRVQEELRSSILERATEHQTAGHTPDHALSLALQEFGDPAVMARGMQRVYTAPRAFLAAMAVLGTAAVFPLLLPKPPAPGSIPSVMSPESAALKRCSLQEIRKYGAGWWDIPGNWWLCHTTMTADRAVFRQSDLLTALEEKGVRTQVDQGRILLQFPGVEQPVDVRFPVWPSGGEVWLDKYRFVTTLAEQLDLPVKLTGTVNPTLTLGDIELQLGTSRAPVDAADLYVGGALGVVTPELGRMLPPGKDWDLAISGAAFDRPNAPTLQVPRTQDGVYVLVDNLDCLARGNGTCGQYTVRVRTSRNSHLPLRAWTDGLAPQLAPTPEAFMEDSRAGQPAVLVWQLDTQNLKRLAIHPITEGLQD